MKRSSVCMIHCLIKSFRNWCKYKNFSPVKMKADLVVYAGEKLLYCWLYSWQIYKITKTDKRKIHIYTSGSDIKLFAFKKENRYFHFNLVTNMINLILNKDLKLKILFAVLFMFSNRTFFLWWIFKWFQIIL